MAYKRPKIMLLAQLFISPQIISFLLSLSLCRFLHLSAPQNPRHLTISLSFPLAITSTVPSQILAPTSLSRHSDRLGFFSSAARVSSLATTTDHVSSSLPHQLEEEDDPDLLSYWDLDSKMKRVAVEVDNEKNVAALIRDMMKTVDSYNEILCAAVEEMKYASEERKKSINLVVL